MSDNASGSSVKNWRKKIKQIKNENKDKTDNVNIKPSTSFVKRMSLGRIKKKKKDKNNSDDGQSPILIKSVSIETVSSSKSDTIDSSSTPDIVSEHRTEIEESSPSVSKSEPDNGYGEERVNEMIQADIEFEIAKLENEQAENPVGMKRECLYKILVIGELGTGKTSIIKRYVHQFFSQHYRATIGVDFALKVLNWDADTIIRLQLWDIAGQERFGNMTRVYYKEAVGAFIVFDVTRVASFEAVLKWKQDLDNKVQLPDGRPIPCILLANKCDQPKEGIVNNPAKMDEFCKENKFSGWYETSAKENVNVEEAARKLISQILENDMSNDNQINSKDNGQFPLEGGGDTSTDKRSCQC